MFVKAILRNIEPHESEFVARGRQPGELRWHEELRKELPIYALARGWAGHASEIGLLHAEIERLRQLVADAASDPERPGAAREADRLRTAVYGRPVASRSVPRSC